MITFQNPYIRSIAFILLWGIIVRDFSLQIVIPFMATSLALEIVWHITSKVTSKATTPDIAAPDVDLFKGYGSKHWHGGKLLQRDPVGDIVIAGDISENSAPTKINIEDGKYFTCVPNLSLTKRWTDSGFQGVIVLNVLPYLNRNGAIHYIMAFGVTAGNPEVIMLVRERRGVMILLDSAVASSKIDINDLRAALRSMESE